MNSTRPLSASYEELVAEALSASFTGWATRQSRKLI
jgi:hypothetical protein